MDTKKLYFSVDINFLCQHFIQKEYESLTQSHDAKYNQIYHYPFWDLFQKKVDENYDFKSDLVNFLSNHLHIPPEIPVDAPMLEVFAKTWIRNQMKSADYITKKNTIAKKFRQKQRIKEFLEKYHSAVYNKETDEIVEADFGDHWYVILNMVKEKFGKDADMKTELFPEIDAWIAENIVLNGNYSASGTYRMKWHCHNYDITNYKRRDANE